MIICCLILSGLFFYADSTYFGKFYPSEGQILTPFRWVLPLIAVAFLLLASFFCIESWGWLTGTWIILMGLMTFLSTIVLLLPVHRRFLHLFCGFALLSLVIDLIVF